MKDLKKYTASVSIERFTENFSVQRNGFSAICFINNGENPVLLNNVMPIAPGAKFALNDEPYVIIETDLYMQNVEDVIVIKTFYNEIRV